VSARLEVRDVSLAFGGIKVLESVDLAVDPGTIYGLVGPNGAGKTSLFNCVSGHYQPSNGSITIDGVSTLDRPAHRMAELGLARTFQHPALQHDASVLDNVLVGGHTRVPGGALAWGLRLPATVRGERTLRRRAMELLDHLGMTWAAGRHAGELPHGLHKRVELARALMSQPKLLLLDEPAGGLPHSEVEELITTIREVKSEFGLTVLLVEHHMGLITALTDRVTVLVQGRKLMEGTAAEAQRHPLVVEAYLGRSAA
jgi:branched-chain amino acid transport system ATP-binding protein